MFLFGWLLFVRRNTEDWPFTAKGSHSTPLVFVITRVFQSPSATAKITLHIKREGTHRGSGSAVCVFNDFAPRMAEIGDGPNKLHSYPAGNCFCCEPSGTFIFIVKKRNVKGSS